MERKIPIPNSFRLRFLTHARIFGHIHYEDKYHPNNPGGFATIICLFRYGGNDVCLKRILYYMVLFIPNFCNHSSEMVTLYISEIF